MLSPVLAALAPEPAEPLPAADDDVVEAISFNTGIVAPFLEVFRPLRPCFATELDAYLLCTWVSHLHLDCLLDRPDGADDDTVCFLGTQDSSKVPCLTPYRQ